MGLVSTLPTRPIMNVAPPKPLRNKWLQTNPYLSAALESKPKPAEDLDQTRNRMPEFPRPNWMRPLEGQNICEPEIVTAEYPNDGQLRRYRRLFNGTQFSEVFLDLSLEARKTVAEALRIGQGAARFSTRLLLDMAVIDALDTQARCTEAVCSVQGVLKYFEIDRLIDPSKGRTWKQLLQSWRRFRDEDLRASRSCLPIVASLPDRYLEISVSPEFSEKEVAAVGENDIPAGKIADANPRALPDVKLADQNDCAKKLSSFGDIRILFLPSSALISRNDVVNIGEIAKILRECPSSRATVEGHTDSIGSADFNRRLSENRAKKVVSTLIAAGADPSQLEARGFGRSRPALRNDSAKSRQLNRRVEMNFGARSH